MASSAVASSAATIEAGTAHILRDLFETKTKTIMTISSVIEFDHR